MGVIVETTPWSIYLKPTISRPYVNISKVIPGIKINPKNGWGRLPISPFFAKMIVDNLSGTAFYIDPQIYKLASAVNFLSSVKNSNHTNLPDPPSKTAWWPHQKQAFYTFMKIFELGFRGVGNLDELGTGKSKVAVGIADALKANLIICVGPRSSTQVWHQEFRKHAIRDYNIILPDLTVGTKERLRRVQVRLRHTNLPSVVVINYDAIWRKPFGDWVLDQEWDLVIADESHRIKTPNSKSSLYMSELRDRTKHRIILTGTPLHHKPLDIWAQYRFMDPGIYGLSYWEFSKRYSSVKHGQEQTRQYKHTEEFSQKLYSVAFRSSGDVLKLPEVVHKTLYTQLSEADSLYKEVEKNVIAQVKNGEITIHNAFVRLVRLQQITSGHIRDDRHRLQVVGHEKEELFEDFLLDFPEREPLVVFCEFHYDMDRVKDIVERHKLKYSEYSGRKDDLDTWKSGKSDVLVVQMRTGAQSIDLTRARYAVYYSFGLSRGDYEQSLKRVHRAGQTRSVTNIHLIVQGTIDERKMKYIEKQTDIVKGLLGEYGRE